MKKQQGEEIIYCYMKVICWGHKNATNKQNRELTKDEKENFPVPK